MVTSLQVCAVLQLLVAMLNLRLRHLLGWNDALDRLPTLVREVFQVHAVFLSLTLAIFGVLTLRFAHDMAGSAVLAAWLAGSIALFWLIRTFVQVFYYSSSHWRGRRKETAIHVAFLGIYGGMTLVYALAALR